MIFIVQVRISTFLNFPSILFSIHPDSRTPENGRRWRTLLGLNYWATAVKPDRRRRRSGTAAAAAFAPVGGGGSRVAGGFESQEPTEF